MPSALTQSLTTEQIAFFFGLLALFLFLLIWLNRRLNQRLYQFLYLCTGSEQMAVLGLYFVFLPGIVLHEGSHWIAALLLRMQPTTLTLWPVKKGSRIEMGSVSMKRASIWRETLVGLAPLFVGTTVITLIVNRIFGLQELIVLVLDVRLGAAWSLFQASMATPDSIPWLYFVFAISNGMLPSASDRQSLALVSYYLGIGVLLYALAARLSVEVTYDWWPALQDRLALPLMALNSLLLLAVLHDALLLGILGFYTYLIKARRARIGKTSRR